MGPLEQFWNNPVNLICTTISLVGLVIGLVWIGLNFKLFRLVLKNLRRNLLRTILTSLAIIVLVLMVTMIWTLVNFLDRLTADRAKDFKIIVTERWQAFGIMPVTHGNYLNPQSPDFLPELKAMKMFRPELKAMGDMFRPEDFMTWSFYGCTMDPEKQAPENTSFFFCMNPRAALTMMDDLEDLDPKLVDVLENNQQACVVGPERLKLLNKKVGERIKMYGTYPYKGIDLELEIIGTLPEGRYEGAGIIHEKYFHAAFDKYKTDHKRNHPMNDRRLSLIWLRVPDRTAFDKVGKIIEDSPMLQSPQVKVETESAGVGNFLEAFQSLLFGMKYLVVPAILAVMALVISNAISISVRERRTEMAVLKVLGYRPGQILGLVLAESLLIGGLSGFLSVGTTKLLFWGGIRFPIVFFPTFPIPLVGLAWGTAVGLLMGLVGSFWPAWSARSVKVSEVFAKVA